MLAERSNNPLLYGAAARAAYRYTHLVVAAQAEQVVLECSMLTIIVMSLDFFDCTFDIIDKRFAG